MLRPRYGIQATGVSSDDYDPPFASFRERKTPDWREAPNPFHPVIHYVDAPAGVGKTAMAVDYIKEQLPLMESNFLMAVPSLHLLREIESRMKSKGITPVVIVHDDPAPDERVTGRLIEFLGKAESFGNVLLMTQQALVRLPWFPRRDNWRLIIDEIPQIDDWADQMELPRNHDLVARWMTAVPLPENDRAVRILPKNQEALSRHLRKSKDDVEVKVRELLEQLASPNKQLYMMTSDWEKLSTGKGFSDKDASQNIIAFAAMLSPDLFRNAVVMGANLKLDFFYLWLSRMKKQTFAEFKGIADAIPANAKGVEGGERPGWEMELIYLFEHSRFSKSLRDKDDNFAKMNEAVQALGIPKDELLIVANKDKQKELRLLDFGTVPDKTDTRGLNCFRGFKAIYAPMALKSKPNVGNLFKTLGFTVAELVTSREVVRFFYQTAGRLPIRDRDFQGKVKMIVPDRFTAEALQAIFEKEGRGKVVLRHSEIQDC